MHNFFIEYYRHSMLNFGQALQGIRFFYSHPDIDPIAPRGSWRHFKLSVLKRSKLIMNDLFFAIIPPHWHHTTEEIKSFHLYPPAKWFVFGYCAWRFDGDGNLLKLTGNEDPRWDPRCK